MTFVPIVDQEFFFFSPLEFISKPFLASISMLSGMQFWLACPKEEITGGRCTQKFSGFPKYFIWKKKKTYLHSIILSNVYTYTIYENTICKAFLFQILDPHGYNGESNSIYQYSFPLSRLFSNC